jgi:DNA-binding transcriptional LysR family regulator
MYVMATIASPSSIRFEPRLLARLNAFVAAHPDLSLSSATNHLVDEALRMQEHPLIVFRDGPAGRRARLVGGPDVWEVVAAVRSVREADPGCTGNDVLDLVAETSGVAVPLLRAALAYWGDYPEEVDAFVERARTEAEQARIRWERERELLDR